MCNCLLRLWQSNLFLEILTVQNKSSYYVNVVIIIPMILWEMALKLPLLQMSSLQKTNFRCLVDKFRKYNQKAYSVILYNFLQYHVCGIWICITSRSLSFWQSVVKYPIEANSLVLFWTHYIHADSPNYSILLYCIFTVYFIYLCCAF